MRGPGEGVGTQGWDTGTQVWGNLGRRWDSWAGTGTGVGLEARAGLGWGGVVARPAEEAAVRTGMRAQVRRPGQGWSPE